MWMSVKVEAIVLVHFWPFFLVESSSEAEDYSGESAVRNFVLHAVFPIP